MTTGEQFAATIRRSMHIGPRTRSRRDGVDIKRDVLESIRNAIQYDGYYSEERTALSRAAIGVLHSYDKHVDGYRIDGTLRFKITTMTPWEFVGLLGEMIDAGVTNVGEGERYFAQMRLAA